MPNTVRKPARLAVAVALLTLWPAGASAAPQMLGVIATLEPVPLICARGVCSAEFTAFCLQERRASPARGTAYAAHDPRRIILTGVKKGTGKTVRLAAADALGIAAERGHSAVRMSVQVDVLRRHNLAALSVEVAEGVTLVPVPVAGDSRAYTEADIEIAAGPLRQAAAAIIDAGGAAVEAARVTAKLANALPGMGRAAPEERDGVWSRVVGATAGGAGQAKARRAYERCRVVTEAGMMTLRQCLGSAHDTFIGGLNNDYWRAIKLGG